MITAVLNIAVVTGFKYRSVLSNNRGIGLVMLAIYIVVTFGLCVTKSLMISNTQMSTHSLFKSI
jgi:hypothetical protein